MDIHIGSEWVQWVLAVVGISLAKALISATFEIEKYPALSPGTYLREREWAQLLLWYVDDLGDAAVLVLLLRAVGFITFT